MLIICSVFFLFWICFFNWWYEKFNYKLFLFESIILYGWYKELNNWEVFNYCLIVVKYNVFVMSICNGILDFDSFLLCFNNKIDIFCIIVFRFNSLL